MQSGHSPAKLYRIIDYWLARPPVDKQGSPEDHKHLVFDGTFLHRPNSIVTLMDASTHTVIAGLCGINEYSSRQLLSFLTPLCERGLAPRSCTTDGNPHAIRAIRNLWPDILLQRCLVHIQRQGLMWCRQNPRREDAKALRGIFLSVTAINTKDEQDRFFEMVRSWEETYGQQVALRPERGRVFSDLKRARSMLLKALPDMFHYLDDPCIPRTTNGLEGYFSRLKRHYRNHRGLQAEKRKSYFDWYFLLRPR